MKRNVKHIACVFSAIIAAAYGTALFAGESSKEIGRTTEKELNVVLSASFGRVSVARGDAQKILVAQGFNKSEGTLPITADYSVRNRVGYLDLCLGELKGDDERKKGGVIKEINLDGGHWDLGFTGEIPISFDMELGVARGDFDLTGLQVKDFKLSAGASSVSLRFDKPNTSTIDQMVIESGVGKFEGINLGNANFKSFKFEGGLGSTTLDFSGQLANEAFVEVNVGLGVCTIVLPKEVGARVLFEESIVSKIKFDRSFHSSNENEWVTDNFKSAANRMVIHVEAGFGSVNVKRSK